ncbi:hypothetical protein SHKM778_48740 [Streptomyces sp. KM77-8]|uniref:Glycosyl hydrolase family 36 C-terminal domain-containing protein n=1 Tax=Streptomyces haneummycinicus TaxID=3074435 RepID=A0AAT9HMC8_9ACTN
MQYTGDGADEVLLLAWRRGPRHGAPHQAVRLRGLIPGERYRDARTGTIHHARVLADYGLHLDLPPGDWASTALHLVRVPEGTA